MVHSIHDRTYTDSYEARVFLVLDKRMDCEGFDRRRGPSLHTRHAVVNLRYLAAQGWRVLSSHDQATMYVCCFWLHVTLVNCIRDFLNYYVNGNTE